MGIFSRSGAAVESGAGSGQIVFATSDEQRRVAEGWTVRPSSGAKTVVVKKGDTNFFTALRR